ncbi:MAG: hypothetical protein ABWJ97_01895 [Thermoproteus sp.]
MRALFLLLLLLPAAALAVQVTVTLVDGTTGAVVNNAMMIIYGPNGELMHVVQGGVFNGDLPPGSYTFEIFVRSVLSCGSCPPYTFNRSIYVQGPTKEKISVPTAFIKAVVIDQASGREADWPVSILGPDNSTLASGRGSVEVEVVAIDEQIKAAANTPYGVFYNSTTPQPGRNYTLAVVVPTAYVVVETYDEALGRPANYTVRLLAGGRLVASGPSPLKAEVLGGSYVASISANLSGHVYLYNEPITVAPGSNKTYSIKVPTALLYVYPQNPLGGVLKNATVLLYLDGTLVLNSTGPLNGAEVLSGNYTVAATYGNLTATASVNVGPGERKVLYLNLTAPVTTTSIKPVATSTARPPASSTTKTVTTTTRTATASNTTTGTAGPAPSVSTGLLYALLALGSAAAALAIGVLAVVLLALRSQ